MANQWFRFKQFKINQDRTAMKVGTDGVLLGAWANFSASGHVLDVGTGTGLIAIMAAQRTKTAIIEAVEIDEDAYRQAQENVAACKWSQRIKLYRGDFKIFAQSCKQHFDHIASNPPFYNSTRKPDGASRALARHDETLSLEDILRGCASLLEPNGRISLILPVQLESELEYVIRNYGLFLSALTYVKPTPTKPPHRILVELAYHEKDYIPNELIIEAFGRHQYSETYRQLTDPFYL